MSERLVAVCSCLFAATQHSPAPPPQVAREGIHGDEYDHDASAHPKDAYWGLEAFSFCFMPFALFMYCTKTVIYILNLTCQLGVLRLRNRCKKVQTHHSHLKV